MRYVWLHGFASGPTSSKGQFAREKLLAQGIELALPDLNQPAFFDLTISRMLDHLDALAGETEPVVLFGSSLGGFTAATWAARRPGRVQALVLLAPAFDLGPRWEKRMGAEAGRWRAQGRFAFDHYARGRKEELSVRFLEDALGYESFPLPRCPTLVIQGSKDEVVAPELAREFVRRMDGRAELLLLPEGHELTADLPALWARIDSFLRTYAPRPTPM